MALRLTLSAAASTPSPVTIPVKTLKFALNGQKHEVASIDPATTLNDYIRLHTKFQGTKNACGEGGCGACVVHLSRYNASTDSIEQHSLNSCLAPLLSLHGAAITTTEGLGTSTEPHPVQERLASFHASQCGFCTPGMAMGIYSTLRASQGDSDLSLTPREAENALCGHICRCTGYRPLLDTCKSFADPQALQDMEDLVCREGLLKPPSPLKPYNPHVHDPPFPDFLRDPEFFGGVAVDWGEEGRGVRWRAPGSFQELSAILGEAAQAEGEEVRLVVGNTMSGVYKQELEKRPSPTLYVSLQNIPELYGCQVAPGGGMWVGGGVTLSQLIVLLEKDEVGGRRSPSYLAVARHLRQVASPHVRHVGSVGGNLVMAAREGFQSDVATLLLGLGSRVRLRRLPLVEGGGGGGEEVEEVGLGAFLERGGLPQGTLLEAVFLPREAEGAEEEEEEERKSRKKKRVYFRSYRAAVRPAGNAHALVNAAFRLELAADGTVEGARLAVGAHEREGAPSVRASRAEAALLTGRPLTRGAILSALRALRAEVAPREGSRQVSYRQSAAVGFLFACLTEAQTGKRVQGSAWERAGGAATRGSQSFAFNKDHFPVSEPLPKTGADLQTTGEAVYVDDISTPAGTLHAALVCSTQPLADISAVDYSAALACPGVVTFLDASCIPPGGQNLGTDGFMGTIPEPLFADKRVEYVGHPIAIIVADTRRHAWQAAQRVKVRYDWSSLPPPVLSLEAAMAASSHFPQSPMMAAMLPKKGDVGEELGRGDRRTILGAQVRSGGQQHFALEPLVALALPDEGGTLTVHASTQSPEGVQKVVATCLGLSQHSVRVITRRLGGSFGGKVLRSYQISTLAALAAHVLRCPVKLLLDRAADMAVLGGRHAVHSTYDVAFTPAGRITALRVASSLDAGFSLGFSSWIPMAFAGALMQYDWGAVEINLNTCKTNLSSTTSVRGPGEVQGSFLAETIIEHVAAELSLPPQAVREANFHSASSLESFFPNRLGADPSQYTLPRVWEQALASAAAGDRTRAVAEFNSTHRWRKRGIAATPVTYKIFQMSKPGRVSVFSDGSVAVEEGGVEMGQGLWTKVQQTAVYGLNRLWEGEEEEAEGGSGGPGRGVGMRDVRVVQQDSISLANGGVTAASSTSEVSCEAVRKACEELVGRLRPVKAEVEEKSGKKAGWREVVAKALAMGVDLSAQSLSDVRGGGYFNFGAAVSEVEVDVLSGETTLLRSDIVYDCGKSLNPAVDIGQVEGAFIMGAGFFTSEEVVVDKDGRLVSNGTWNYKPPTFDTIPRELNVSLLQNAPNARGILSSKASGEPPLLLSASIHMAIRQAISAARTDNGEAESSRFFRLDAPATIDRIKAACGYNAVEEYLEKSLQEEEAHGDVDKILKA